MIFVRKNSLKWLPLLIAIGLLIAGVASAASGDINGDGLFDEQDVQTLREYLVGDIRTINTIVADLDADGMVGMSDLILMERYVARGERPGDGIITTKTGANACAFGVTNGLIVEIVLTMIFVLVVLGATAKTNGATNNFAGLAIGLSLILIHLVGIHFTGTSVNPARSIGPALFEGGQALSDLWVFIVGPLVGGALAACIWKIIDCDCDKKAE